MANKINQNPAGIIVSIEEYEPDITQKKPLYAHHLKKNYVKLEISGTQGREKGEVTDTEAKELAAEVAERIKHKLQHASDFLYFPEYQSGKIADTQDELPLFKVSTPAYNHQTKNSSLVIQHSAAAPNMRMPDTTDRTLSAERILGVLEQIQLASRADFADAPARKAPGRRGR